MQRDHRGPGLGPPTALNSKENASKVVCARPEIVIVRSETSLYELHVQLSSLFRGNLPIDLCLVITSSMQWTLLINRGYNLCFNQGKESNLALSELSEYVATLKKFKSDKFIVCGHSKTTLLAGPGILGCSPKKIFSRGGENIWAI